MNVDQQFDLFKGLGIVVLVNQGGDRFNQVGDSPAWLKAAT